MGRLECRRALKRWKCLKNDKRGNEESFHEFEVKFVPMKMRKGKIKCMVRLKREKTS